MAPKQAIATAASAEGFKTRLAGTVRPLVTSPIIHRIALLGLCAAYLQGGLVKVTDFPGAVAVIALELGAATLILTGYGRWLGALALAGFTLPATLLANRFWEMAPPERVMTANALFEHLGLVGGFLLVAWHDLRDRPRPPARPS